MMSHLEEGNNHNLGYIHLMMMVVVGSSCRIAPAKTAVVVSCTWVPMAASVVAGSLSWWPASKEVDLPVSVRG